MGSIGPTGISGDLGSTGPTGPAGEAQLSSLVARYGSINASPVLMNLNPRQVFPIGPLELDNTVPGSISIVDAFGLGYTNTMIFNNIPRGFYRIHLIALFGLNSSDDFLPNSTILHGAANQNGSLAGTNVTNIRGPSVKEIHGNTVALLQNGDTFSFYLTSTGNQGTFQILPGSGTSIPGLPAVSSYGSVEIQFLSGA
jgi:hypothetical protein